MQLSRLEAEKKEKKRKASKEKKKIDFENFMRCKSSCVCEQFPCYAAGLKQCPSCNDVLKSVCSKVKCRNKDGSKPVMLSSNISSTKKQFRRKLFNLIDSEEEEDTDMHNENDEEKELENVN